MTPEQKIKFDQLKEYYIGKKVLITGNHPWVGEIGTVLSLDHTNAGYGFMVELENGQSCYVFNGSHMKLILEDEK